MRSLPPLTHAEFVAATRTWVDAGANYDGEVRTGRYFTGDYSGTGIHLGSFEDTYRRSGVPMDFVSHVDLLDPRGEPIGMACAAMLMWPVWAGNALLGR